MLQDFFKKLEHTKIPLLNNVQPIVTGMLIGA